MQLLSQASRSTFYKKAIKINSKCQCQKYLLCYFTFRSGFSIKLIDYLHSDLTHESSWVINHCFMITWWTLFFPKGHTTVIFFSAWFIPQIWSLFFYSFKDEALYKASHEVSQMFWSEHSVFKTKQLRCLIKSLVRGFEWLEILGLSQMSHSVS